MPDSLAGLGDPGHSDRQWEPYVNVRFAQAPEVIGDRIAAMSAGTSTQWAAHALDTLRRAGHRRGAALVAVIESLDRSGGFRTADGLVAELRATGRPAGRTSVYRVLDVLVQHELVQRVEVADGPARFEVHRGRRRHHMVCRACGGVLRFDDDRWSQAIAELSARLGADIDAHDTLLQGRCRRCSTAARAAACERCG
jgi:Fe2+ or Zn2+ uptake regulation protein